MVAIRPLQIPDDHGQFRRLKILPGKQLHFQISANIHRKRRDKAGMHFMSWL